MAATPRAGVRARRRRPVRLRAEEGLAELRHRARQGLRAAGAARGPAAACSPPRCCARFPHLPIEEEGRFADPRLRENFIERVFAYRRLARSVQSPLDASAISSRFHTAHKLVAAGALAEAPTASLGRLVAAARRRRAPTLRDEYSRGFMEALAAIATPRAHVNVLQHMVGYFKKRWTRARRRNCGARSTTTARGSCRWSCRSRSLAASRAAAGRRAIWPSQIYLEPHPKELMLRNHV